MHRIAALLLCVSLPVLAPWPAWSAWLEPTQDGLAVTDWTLGRAMATGLGRLPVEGGLAQRRLMAQRAATADAYRQLTALVHGIKVNSERRVTDYAAADGNLKRRVEGVIKGAQVKDIRFLPDYSVEVDVMMPIYGANQLFVAVLGDRFQPRQGAFPGMPVLGMPVWLAQSGPYTGLIIDCTGLGMSAGMSPAVRREDGSELYPANLPVSADYVVNEGVVGYAHGLQEAKSHLMRIGSNPLVVRAKAATGQFKLDPVLDAETAQRILEAEALGPFLGQSKVVFAL